MVSSSCSTTSTELPRRRSLFQGGQQLLVIARVQADGRLVQDVKHAAEIGAELRRQPDALAFAAGKRRHAATQLQVAEANFTRGTSAAREFPAGCPGRSGPRGPSNSRVQRNPGGINGELRQGIDGRCRLAQGAGRMDAPGFPAAPRGRRDAAALRRTRDKFRVAFLPSIPGFLDGICPRPAVHLGKIKELAETAALGAPALGRIVTEILGIQRLERALALRTSSLGGMHGSLAALIEAEQSAFADLQSFLKQGERARRSSLLSPSTPCRTYRARR